MVNLTESLAYSGLIPPEITPCSICGNSVAYEFKQGYICEECIEYVTKKIELEEKASKPVSYP